MINSLLRHAQNIFLGVAFLDALKLSWSPSVAGAITTAGMIALAAVWPYTGLAVPGSRGDE